MKKIGLVILAAGGSTRLGQPKQLLPYKGQTLLLHTIGCATALSCIAPLVVISAASETIKEQVMATGISVAVNKNWRNGIATSVTCGLKALRKQEPELEACIFTVCDQPYISATLFSEMIQRYRQSGKGIVAAAYDNTIGTPVLFDKKYFTGLQKLQKDEGAKKLMFLHINDLTAIAFEAGAIDIDTPDDYKKLANADR